MVETISKDLLSETATRMGFVTCKLLLSHNRESVKLFKLLYLNHAQVTAERT